MGHFLDATRTKNGQKFIHFLLHPLFTQPYFCIFFLPHKYTVFFYIFSNILIFFPIFTLAFCLLIMVCSYKPKVKVFKAATIEGSINEVKKGVSIKSTAAKYGMSHRLLHNRIQDRKGKRAKLMKKVYIYNTRMFSSIKTKIVDVQVFSNIYIYYECFLLFQGQKTDLSQHWSSNW